MVVAVLTAFVSLQAAQAQPPVDPDILLLSRARTKMAAAIRRMPNYTCLETIERSKRLAKRRKYELIDVLRLEVGIVGGRELFAWPGSGKFEDKELADMVPAGGAIGNGSFGAHAASIFSNGVASITFGARDGNSARYDFRVPQNLSGYRIRNGRNVEAVIGYHGNFVVESNTERVTSIAVVGDDIPPFLDVLGTEATIDYGMVKIGEQDYWLPVGSSMKITSLDSSEFRNEIKFTGCRQFAGESTLSFEDPPPTDANPPSAIAKDELVTMPKDKVFSVELVTPIVWKQNKTGDLVEGAIAGDIKHKGVVLFPRGAKVTGRILRFQSLGNGQVVEIQFESITDGARHAPFKAVFFDRAESTSLMRTPTPQSRARQVYAVRGQPGAFAVASYNLNVELRKGYRSTWVTLE